MCVFVYFGRAEVSWNSFLTFAIKRQRRDAMSVTLCNSVNSAVICNMEITIKMSIIIIIIIIIIILIMTL